MFIYLFIKDVLKNLIGNFNNQNNNSNTNTNTSLEPTPEFKEFFLNPDLITLLFKCYELVRDDPDMAHASMQPLIQLSTLDGPIFKDDDTDSTAAAHTHRRVLFLNNFLQAFLATFTKYFQIIFSDISINNPLNFSNQLEFKLESMNRLI